MNRAVAAIAGLTMAALPIPVYASDQPCWDSAWRCRDTNEFRVENGQDRLRQRGWLQRGAKAYAAELARRGYLVHSAGAYGENIGYGSSWREVQDAWEISPAHRANLLDEGYEEIGIGSYRDPTGRRWFVVRFH